MAKIFKPIFIIGTGRCGSTLFHKMLSRHPQVAWLSGFCNYLPEAPLVNRLVLAADSHSWSQKMLRRFLSPSEAIYYWEHLAPGFTVATHDLKAVDVHENVRQKIKVGLGRQLTARKHRLLHKFTGWPRTEYLLEVFPDAKFIHVFRDGRAVAHSLFTVKWWQGWAGPGNWIWGSLPPIYQKEWEESGQAFLVLAAIQWKLLMDVYGEARQSVPAGQFFDIKYEKLIENPVAVFNDVIKFCELAPSPAFAGYVASRELQGRNDKWQQQLTESQKKLLQHSLAGHLARYGYQ